MKRDNILETKLIQAGRPVGLYQVLPDGNLALKKIEFPEIPLPFDIAVLPDTRTDSGDNLHLILIEEVSHPPQTQVEVRLLGGISLNGAEPCLLGVPLADQQYLGLERIADIPETLREAISQYLGHYLGSTTEMDWLDADEALSIVHQALARSRQAKLEIDRGMSNKPSWLPVDRAGRVTSYSEREHYTDAEYTYFLLPYRFQKYMDEHLAADERILFSLSRPAMRSRITGSWLNRVKLQEGVLVLTDQRLVFLVELIPPDSSGVRYGFESSIGVLERLAGVELKSLDDSLILRTAWRAASGAETLEWEFPVHCLSALEELVNFLARFVADSRQSSAIRRATLPPAPEKLPPLRDPAANDPAENEAVFARFSSSLPGWLDPAEKFLSWALIPSWFDKKGVAQVLLITDRRILQIPEPTTHAAPEIDIPYPKISSLKYVSSILSSYIVLTFLDSGNCQNVRVDFPYPSERAFHTCLETLRRCLALAPSC